MARDTSQPGSPCVPVDDCECNLGYVHDVVDGCVDFDECSNGTVCEGKEANQSGFLELYPIS